MGRFSGSFAVFILCVALSGCYQVQVSGPVAGATVSISELDGTGDAKQLQSWVRGDAEAAFGADDVAGYPDVLQLALLGLVLPDKSAYAEDGYYLVAVTGGEDFDTDHDLVSDEAGTPLLGTVYSISGADELRRNRLQISVLSDIVYRYMQPHLNGLHETDLEAQLDVLARRLVGDVSEDGTVNYADLQRFSQLFHRGLLRVDISLLSQYEVSLRAGASDFELRSQALAILDSSSYLDGEVVYRLPQPSGNSFTCASCHEIVEPASNGYRRPGHPIGDATRRPSYKNGQLTSMVDAVNSCLDEWMNAETFTESSAEYVALHEWLEQRAAPGEAEAVSVQVVSPPADLSGGDPVEGRNTFNASCAGCHNIDGTGTIRAPGVVGFGLSPELVANRVRSSGRTDSGVYDGLTGGIMPFWGANRLSDEELLDLVAYLELTDDANDPPASGGSDGGGAGASGCDADHPSVGKTLEFSTLQHDVSGTATIIDNCSIQITNFNYDGRGIVVQVYSGIDGRFRGNAGMAISPDLVGPAYSNATLDITLPDDLTLDDFNSLSIWCVEVGVSFGDGIFE